VKRCLLRKPQCPPTRRPAQRYPYKPINLDTNFADQIRCR
jgi:hypothetical protein